MPQVSVIIPVYNDSTGVERILSALAQQSYPSDLIEVIVVDNGSQPPLSLDTSGLPFRSRILVCPVAGSYAARNYGTRSAQGEILAFTDADCIPERRWLELGVSQLLKLVENKWIVGGEILFLEPAQRSGTALYQYLIGFQQAENIAERNFSATANLFCWASTFSQVGPFDERLLSGGDREWCWRAEKLGIHVVYCPRAIIHTHVRSSLRGAIRQARRVAAGRRELKALKITHMGDEKVAPHRSGLSALMWILSNTELNGVQKAKVLFAATVIKLASILEEARLRLGSKPERR
jgi:glycosyltransferase involved in cell wall biosynthesis